MAQTRVIHRKVRLPASAASATPLGTSTHTSHVETHPVPLPSFALMWAWRSSEAAGILSVLCLWEACEVFVLPGCLCNFQEKRQSRD